MSPFERKVALHHYSGGGLTGTVTLTLHFEQEGGQWVGVCLELGSSAYAASLEEADAELVDAVLLQLNEIERLGFIAEFLRDHNVPEEPVASQPPENQTWVVARSS